MEFSEALKYITTGRCMRRASWAKTYCIIMKDNYICAHVNKDGKFEQIEKKTESDRFFSIEDVTARDWEEYKEFYKSSKEVNESTYAAYTCFKGYILYKTIVGKKFFYGGVRLPAKVTTYDIAERFIHKYLTPTMIKLHLCIPKDNYYLPDDRVFPDSAKETIEKVIKENWSFNVDELPKIYEITF
jgi:hypothetical protein